MDQAKEFQPDEGAILSAAIRALEWEKPAGERICEDPYARALIGEEGMEMARQRQQSPYMTGLRKVVCDVNAIIVLRTRYIDDYIRRGLAQGIRQLVILGAGYDSRALRIEGLKQARIFEIDRPPNLEDKMEKVKKVAGQLPPQVTYVGIDFLEETLEDLRRKLVEWEYDPQSKSLFVLEGLVSHLSLKAVDELMRFISSFAAPGSSMVCTYPHGNMADELERLRAGSEPTFGMDPPLMVRFLEDRGFCRVHNLTLEEAYRLYRKKEPHALEPYSFVEATVGRNR